MARKIPRPFLKWAGGKRRLLDDLRPRVPDAFERYLEPFVGGGALFFALRPRQAILGDANRRLVRTYCGVRDAVEEVIERLGECVHSEAYFLEVRSRDIDAAESDAEVAAWMIYLNRTGYNGLYRVNRKNRFNVPFGRYDAPRICDADNLRACAAVLADVEIRHGDFGWVADEAARGDFVYFDPPYVPASETASFTSYTRAGFDLDDQRRLRDLALGLKDRGASVLLSNSATPETRDLYTEGFDRAEVAVARAINSKAHRRGPVPELIVW